MQKEMIQIRSFSRALSIICTIIIVLLCIGAFFMLIALLMSGNSEFMAILERAFNDAGVSDAMQIFGYFMAYLLLSIAVYLVIAFMLRTVLRNIADYHIFAGENAKRLDRVAYILIISAFVLPLVLAVGNFAVLGTLSYNISISNIIIGLALLLISKLLLYGRTQQYALDEAREELKKRYEKEQGVLSSNDIFKEI